MVFLDFLLVFLIVLSEIDFLEKVEKGLNLLLYGFLFVFIFLLNRLDSNVLALLPVDIITKASLDLITFDLKLLRQSRVSKPFVFSKGESNLKAVFALFGSSDLSQVFEKRLVDLSDLFADDVARNQGLEPVLIEEFLLVVVVFQTVFLFGQDCVGLEVAVSVIVSACDDVVNLFN